MTPELELARFVHSVRYDDLPGDVRQTVTWIGMAALGAAIAGVREDGIDALRQLLLERAGAPQASTLVFGDRLPAVAAAQFNATLCRALDYCDAMAPGPHFGSAVWPSALAAAELAGTATGRDVMTAVAVGCEVGARFNLDESQYAGFDPTGVAAVFAATASAARLLQLTDTQTVHAFGLAFNRCGGSFQSHIDGSLGVRIVQGWVAQAGVECAQLAQRGVSGPNAFLTGVYGFPVLFGRGRLTTEQVVGDLGRQWRLMQTMFKKYPSCGATQGLTELCLQAVQELAPVPAGIERVSVRLNPYCHRLVGHAFRVGPNPRVDAQFSARYCAANALVRGASKLAHFAPDAIEDPSVRALMQRVEVVSDPALDARGHTAVDVQIRLHDGRSWSRGLDVAPGFPGWPLSAGQQRARFADCVAYSPHPWSHERIDDLLGVLHEPDRWGSVGKFLRLLVT